MRQGPRRPPLSLGVANSGESNAVFILYGHYGSYGSCGFMGITQWLLLSTRRFARHFDRTLLFDPPLPSSAVSPLLLLSEPGHACHLYIYMIYYYELIYYDPLAQATWLESEVLD